MVPLARVLRRRSRVGALQRHVERARREWIATLDLTGRVLDLTGRTEFPEGETYDVIFMDRSMERLEIGRLRDVLRDIRTHLSPHGRFVFDTPNRRLTRIVSRRRVLRRGHTYEFAPREMDEILLRHGFTVTGRVGLVPLPRTMATGVFDPSEIDDEQLVSGDIAACAVFAYECRPRPVPDQPG